MRPNVSSQEAQNHWCYRYRDRQLTPGPFCPIKVAIYEYIKTYEAMSSLMAKSEFVIAYVN